jgi:hypothetical protein
VTPVAYVPFVAPPQILRVEGPVPTALGRVTLSELCELAGIPCRVTSPHLPTVTVHAGASHYRGPDGLWVGLDGAFTRSALEALRILEVLAHGFHDYGARECVCGRGLFVAPVRRGRPAQWGRAMSAAERMRRLRRRRSGR